MSKARLTAVALMLISASRLFPGTSAEKFSHDDDLIIQYHGRNVSTFEILRRLNYTGKFTYSNLLCSREQVSCEGRCINGTASRRERASRRSCYCDQQCEEIGDCCFDYFARCSAPQGSIEPKEILIKCVNMVGSGPHGYIMTTRCPEHVIDTTMKELCEKQDDEDILRSVPVEDKADGKVYRNVFCARCNSKVNFSYWKIEAECQDPGVPVMKISQNKSLLMSLVKEKCDINYTSPHENTSSIQRCLAVAEQCTWEEGSPTEPILTDLCSFYSLPAICEYSIKKNPHCSLCIGEDLTQNNYCECRQDPGFPQMPDSNLEASSTSAPRLPPPINILFDFSGTANKVQIGKKTMVLSHQRCPEGFIYDPFIDTCRQTFSGVSQKDHYFNTSTPVEIKKSVSDMTNCSLIKVLLSETTLYPNGTLWVPLHALSYNRSMFFINDTNVFLCTSFHQNYTKKEVRLSYKLTSVQLLTYIGGSVSVTSLLFLNVIYLLCKELRTLPGKCLMNLAFSLMMYHICLFVAAYTNIWELCVAISAFLHCFVLSSFLWMSVMAFEVTKTFVFGGYGPQFRGSTSSMLTMLKYCLYAWGFPATVVAVCIVLDVTGAVSFGYGVGEFCWIGNGTVLIFVLGFPVGLVLLFDSVALTWTIVSIYQTQQVTQRLSDQRDHHSLALLCVKLASVLGLTWVLGFVSFAAKNDVITYLFVITNSLQGFFIFLAFIANKRTVALIRNAVSNKKSRARHHDNTMFTTKL